ncbi:DUF4282 domain-containing protein [Sphingomonas canadensis]|uniref:DUF4282 domain-containing protein n=1 Tax=Sphingomonas canadensis TaxID=1219257 RepID=A0ABW3H4E6_9SPHN|nr:DUF4282 domain-containing protein [Sphingomonas canadensis]MCW3835894.1 DUF4282 domain-containing protein [Sphingomonas canadensis]
MDNGFFGKLLSFDEMIGGMLIRILYYIGLVGIAIYSLVLLAAAFSAAQYSVGYFLLGIGAAVICLVVGTLFWRFYCELMILMFRIYDRMGEIRDRLPPAP